MSLVAFTTPQKSKDIRDYACQIIRSEIADLAIARVLFRKVAKGLNDKDFVIA
jgi:hypothetical protein